MALFIKKNYYRIEINLHWYELNLFLFYSTLHLLLNSSHCYGITRGIEWLEVFRLEDLISSPSCGCLVSNLRYLRFGVSQTQEEYLDIHSKGLLQITDEEKTPQMIIQVLLEIHSASIKVWLQCIDQCWLILGSQWNCRHTGKHGWTG